MMKGGFTIKKNKNYLSIKIESQVNNNYFYQ